MKLISWNVNGIRAIEKKGFADYVQAQDADVYCIQEIKAMPEQVPESLRTIPGYETWWNSAERKGYSGTGILSRVEPKSVQFGFGNPDFDQEGRTLIMDFDSFVLYNIYFPNGGANDDRLKFKLDFYELFHQHVLDQVRQDRQVVVCGDFNTAHKAIDLARPEPNRKVSGFLPVECAFLDRFVDSGFIDTFREFNQDPEQYTWWDMKSRARDRNVGWRLDYFFINSAMKNRLDKAFIQPEIMGSDHCPVGLDIQTDG